MAKLYIANAFSLNMIPFDNFNIAGAKVSVEQAREIIRRAKELLNMEIVSAIGHESTAKLASELLGIEVPMNRIAIKLDDADRVLVIQILERLPEGKVLNEHEIRELLQKGKIAIYYLMVFKTAGITPP